MIAAGVLLALAISLAALARGEWIPLALFIVTGLTWGGAATVLVFAALAFVDALYLTARRRPSGSH